MGDESECLDADENIPIAPAKIDSQIVFNYGVQKSPKNLTSREMS